MMTAIEIALELVPHLLLSDEPLTPAARRRLADELYRQASERESLELHLERIKTAVG